MYRAVILHGKGDMKREILGGVIQQKYQLFTGKNACLDPKKLIPLSDDKGISLMDVSDESSPSMMKGEDDLTVF